MGLVENRRNTIANAEVINDEVVIEMPSTRYKIITDLDATVEELDAEVNKRLSWINIITHVGKIIGKDVVKRPFFSGFKVMYLASVGFIAYLLVRGFVAGVVVDKNTKISDLSSSDKTVQMNAGLNLTNADQAGQFLIDLIAVLVVTYGLVLRKPYFEFARKTTEDVYKARLDAMEQEEYSELRNFQSNELLEIMQSKLQNYA